MAKPEVKREKRNEIKSLRVAIESWAALIESPIINQANHCRDFSNRLLGQIRIHPEAISFNLMVVKNLLDIDIKKYIDAYLTNAKGGDKRKIGVSFRLY